jgi:uncharacterized protein with ATP-grasp and redox domains
MHDDCFTCDCNQIHKISTFLELDEATENHLLTMTNEYLQNCDRTKTNPEIMGEIWKRITTILENDNPYRDIKARYNQLMLSLEEEIEKIIEVSKQPLKMALKLAVLANIIDFSAKHEFDEQTVKDKLMQAENIQLAQDDSDKLFDALSQAKSLLYIGDNCGEIVIDKMFIRKIKQLYQNLHVTYGVRGQAIVNDVTIEDAKDVNMKDVAEIISNGDGSLGTVLSRTSAQFQNVFSDSDVIIAKGQGNFEGLSDMVDRHIFFLFMAKCDLVAELVGVEKMSIVCMENF